MSRFHSLTVTGLTRTIRDAVVVRLAPEPGEAALFDYAPGQYLTFRREIDGEELRRSYSICAGPGEGLAVAIKRVEGGAFSGWANESLKVGDRLEAMVPAGSFTTPIDPAAHRAYLAFAGGSGITPVMSLLKAVLSEEPESEFTLVYANKSVATIMFREELEELKNRYMGRLSVVHVLEDDAQEIDLFTGLVDEAKCAALFAHWIDIKSIDTAFICGPEPMMLGIARALRAHGLGDAQIRFELFASSAQKGRVKRPAAPAPKAGDNVVRARVTLDGAAREIEVPPDTSLLEAARAANLDAPYACKAGVCSTCRAKVTEGEVEMRANHALEDYEVAQGYVLTCQCYPVSARVAVDYDQ